MKEKLGLNKKDTSLESPPPDISILQEETNYEKKEKAPIILAAIFALIAATVIGGVTYIYLCNNVLNKADEGSYIQEDTSDEENRNAQFEPIRKIAYITSSNVWYYDLSEKKSFQVTGNGNEISPYTSLAWKNKNELTFAKCSQQTCSAQTYNISEETISDSFDIETDEVPTLRWSHKGEQLAYLFKKESKLHLAIRSEESTKEIGEFDYQDNRLFDFNDALYIRFSPNDEMVMLVNTFTDLDNSSISVIDLDGNFIASIKGDGTQHPTFGFFSSNETIYYKKEDLLYVRSLTEGTEVKLTDRIVGAFNFHPSPDKSKITYWTFNWLDGVATIWVYDIGEESIKRLRDQETFPMWTDDETIVALHLPDCIKCPRNDLEFSGFTKADLETKVVSSLFDLEEVEYFAVENF